MYLVLTYGEASLGLDLYAELYETREDAVFAVFGRDDVSPVLIRALRELIDEFHSDQGYDEQIEREWIVDYLLEVSVDGLPTHPGEDETRLDDDLYLSFLDEVDEIAELCNLLNPSSIIEMNVGDGPKMVIGQSSYMS